MSEQRCVQIDGRDYTVSPWTLRETLGKRSIVDGLPDMYRRVPDSEPDSDEDDASSAADIMSHYHKHYDQTDREKDAVRYRRDQTSRQFAVSQSMRPCCCNTCCPRKPTYSKKALAKDFFSQRIIHSKSAGRIVTRVTQTKSQWQRATTSECNHIQRSNYSRTWIGR